MSGPPGRDVWLLLGGLPDQRPGAPALKQGRQDWNHIRVQSCRHFREEEKLLTLAATVLVGLLRTARARGIGIRIVLHADTSAGVTFAFQSGANTEPRNLRRRRIGGSDASRLVRRAEQFTKV